MGLLKGVWEYLEYVLNRLINFKIIVINYWEECFFSDWYVVCYVLVCENWIMKKIWCLGYFYLIWMDILYKWKI